MVESVQERLQALSDEILRLEGERARLVQEGTVHLAPFGHRSVMLKAAEAGEYLERKVGDKPPSDRLIDEQIAIIRIGSIAAARLVQEVTTRDLALKDAEIDAKKREWQALQRYGQQGG